MAPDYAKEHLYAPDAQGVMRLVAAPGDPIPDNLAAAAAARTPVVNAPATAPVSADELPIEGYDRLSEAEVLTFLPGLDPADLERVRAYEQAHQARGSITRFGLDTRPVGARTARPRAATEPPAPAPPVAPQDAAKPSAGAEGGEPAVEPGQGASAPPDGDWGKLDREALEAEASRRDLEVQGTGKDGQVTKKDLVAALSESGGGAGAA